MYTTSVIAFLDYTKCHNACPESKIAVANNDNYCPDIFKHSRLLAEAMMETLKNI
jgi:hypothetical protein